MARADGGWTADEWARAERNADWILQTARSRAQSRDSAADSDDVRGPAAELLLALFADGGARPALLRAGAVGALERLAAASWSELVAARAKQALGEFHEEDAF